MASEWVWHEGVSYADRVAATAAATNEAAQIERNIRAGIAPAGAPPVVRYRVLALRDNPDTPIPQSARNAYPHPALDHWSSLGEYHQFSTWLDKVGTGFTIAVGATVGIGAFAALSGAAGSIGSALSSTASSVEGSVSSIVSGAGSAVSSVGSVLGTVSKAAALLTAVKSKLSGAPKKPSAASYESVPTFDMQTQPSNAPVLIAALAGAAALGYLLLERN